MGIIFGNPQEKHKPCDNELPSTSWDTESRSPFVALSQKRGKRKALDDDGPVETKKRRLDPSAMFKAKYEQLKEFGKGGSGFVLAGYRKADHLPVAIKYIPRHKVVHYHKDNTGKLIPMEVAIMLKIAAESERHSATIDLLDWYDLEREVILVLERPMPAVDLLKYMNAKGGCLNETESKIILRQLVDAAIDLHRKHIFHRDIKVENVLIETCTDRIRIRVIDFGASCFFKEGDAFEDFRGTHIPPEFFSRKKYKAGPSTVFQMGVLLYNLVQPTSFRWELYCQEGQRITGEHSENCRDFLMACLHEDPDQRLTLEQLRSHLWLR
ncbi:serine/threonine-protein kinase pim-2-like [Clinocottus analis]|uniref:serine/threonine-protein kinase pim-2-like n=1 Tax=Clinocottus analis TaxID=304258 RepID=UPI0035C24058